jgi:hypothetical protein
MLSKRLAKPMKQSVLSDLFLRTTSQSKASKKVEEEEMHDHLEKLKKSLNGR